MIQQLCQVTVQALSFDILTFPLFIYTWFLTFSSLAFLFLPASYQDIRNSSSSSINLWRMTIIPGSVDACMLLGKQQTTLQSRTGPVQGQYRVFPVYFSHAGKTLFSLQGFQVMTTGFSLLGKVHREIPVFLTGVGLQCTYTVSHNNSWDSDTEPYTFLTE